MSSGNKQQAEPQVPMQKRATRAMNPTEAITAFCAYVTTRKEPTCFGSSVNAGPAGKRIGEFVEHNDLPDVERGWEDLFSMPTAPEGA